MTKLMLLLLLPTWVWSICDDSPPTLKIDQVFALRSMIWNKAVVQELEIVKRQREDLRRAESQYNKAVAAVYKENPRPSPRRYESREEGLKVYRDYQEKIKKELYQPAARYRKRVHEILLPFQIRRLNQLHIQREGVRGLLLSHVKQELALTKKQVETIVEIQKEASRRRLNRHDTRERNELSQEALELALAVLTADQREKFRKLCGKPFSLAGDGPTSQRD